MSHAKKVRGSYGGGGLGTPAVGREMGISLTGPVVKTPNSLGSIPGQGSPTGRRAWQKINKNKAC